MFGWGIVLGAMGGGCSGGGDSCCFCCCCSRSLRARRLKNHIAAARIANTATPPTTPPAMAPALLLPEEGWGSGEGREFWFEDSPAGVMVDVLAEEIEEDVKEEEVVEV